MVDSMDTFKSFNINIETVMKNLEMLKLVLHHLKLSICVTMQLKNYLIC